MFDNVSIDFEIGLRICSNGFFSSRSDGHIKILDYEEIFLLLLRGFVNNYQKFKFCSSKMLYCEIW